MRNTNFWKKAAKSLPEPYRSRYAGHFVRAERWESALDGLAGFAASVIRSTRPGRQA
jgi:hypothetical protein